MILEKQNPSAVSNDMGLIHHTEYYLYPVAFYSKIWGRFDMAYHSHAYYEIMYVEEGECTVKIQFHDEAGEIRKTAILLKRNMAIFINSAIYHRLVVSESAKMLHLEFERRSVRGVAGAIDFNVVVHHAQLLKMLLARNSRYYLFVDAHEAVSPIKRIHAELMEGLVLQDDNFLLVQAYVFELFIKLAKIFRDNSYRGGIVYVKKALAYIRSNYTKHLSVDMISETLGVSSGYLHKLVKDETGKTVVEIINDFRINKAKQLIGSTTFPLIDIAIECGFSNRQNFWHIFRKLVGMSPQEYRNGKGTYNQYHFGNDYVNSHYHETDSDG